MRSPRSHRGGTRLARAVAGGYSRAHNRSIQGPVFRHPPTGNSGPVRGRAPQGRAAGRMTQTRRLAAILAADVAGYSRLIGADESGTLQALKAIRVELVDPTIAAHNGRLVKTTGDGLLVEFGSVVDALRCATEMQAGMAQRNAPTPADKRIEFRMGINM